MRLRLPSTAAVLAAGSLGLFGLLPATVRADDSAPAEPPKEKESAKEHEKEHEKEPAKEAEAKAPETVEVTKKPFAVHLECAGTFEPAEPSEALYEPEVYGGELEVVEAFAGGPVEKGQVLVRFSTESIDEQITAAERDVRATELAVGRQRDDAKKAAEASAIAIARAQAESDAAARALKRFVDTERDMRSQESTLRMKGTDDSIRDAELELEQLRKMYKADDVAEKTETEKIVLERTERQLERMKKNRDFQWNRHQWYLSVDLPEEQKGLELSARKEAVELDRAKANATPTLEIAAIDLQKAESDLEKKAKALGKLKKDREGLVLKAGRAGIAIPGAFAHGKWAGVDETAKLLEKGKKLRVNVPVFTIISKGDVALRTAVPESRILEVAAGQPVEVKPTADDRKSLKGRVVRIAATPGEGGYEVRVELEGKDARLIPGFTAKAKILVREAEAITVPAASVVADGEKRLVHVVGADDKATPREVKLGDASDGAVEVLEGLAAGDRVLKSPPKP